MARSGLLGPYRLDVEGIDRAVAGETIGAFMLGHTDHEETFFVSHVGRSDGDLRLELRNHIGCDQHFKFARMPSAQAAFEKECELFHRFDPPRNFLHPSRPAGASWECRYCRADDR